MSDDPKAEASAAIDWAAISRRLDDVFTKDCDPYGTAVNLLFGSSQTSEEHQTRRTLFKMVFHRVFQLRAPLLIASSFDYTERLVEELKKRELFTDVNNTVNDAITADMIEREKRLRLEGVLP